MTGQKVSAIPIEARPYQGGTAGLVTRTLANTVDAVVVAVVLGAVYLGYVAFTFLLDPRSFQWPEGNPFLSVTAGLVLATSYLWLAWWIFGRTYGDHIMGLRVTGRRRPKLGPLRALARAAFCVVFPIGLFWCAISPRRLSVQDIVVHSSVVYDWSRRSLAEQRVPLDGGPPTDRPRG